MVDGSGLIGGSGVGLVLSGGGMRGAYEVGVIAGIVEVLGIQASEAAPFQIFAGTSVGAINATYFVANAHRGDMAVREFADIWKGLKIHSHLRLHPWGIVPSLRRAKQGNDDYLGKSLLDPRPLELLVRRSVSWERLHANIASGIVSALFIAALDVSSGRTALFTELAPDSPFRPSRDPRRTAVYGPIEADHVLASAAIPLMFPARRVGDSYFCDGGLRFNTPIAPAIRAGAERLVVVTTTSPSAGTRRVDVLEQYPSLPCLAGKILNALLLDPMSYDLQVLHRTNGIVESLEGALTPESLAAVQRKIIEARGVPYRKLETLLFAPSEDIGQMAADHLRTHLDGWDLGRLPRWLLAKAADEQATWEADWATYLLFDGVFGERLVELGRRDALARTDEIRDFFQRATRRFSKAPPSG